MVLEKLFSKWVESILSQKSLPFLGIRAKLETKIRWKIKFELEWKRLGIGFCAGKPFEDENY